MNIPYNSQLVLHTGTLRANYAALRAELGSVQVIPVLKCNAYGIGAVAVAKTLLSCPEPPRLLAVAQASEVLALRAAGVAADILLLGPVPAHALPAAVAARASFTVFTPGTAAALDAEAAKQGLPFINIHIKIETGLNRYGAKPGAELAALAAAVQKHSRLRVAGAFSHLADGEQVGSTLAKQQLALFLQGVGQLQAAGIPVPQRHLCASGAAEWFRESYLDAVRIGRRLYLDAPCLPGAAAPTGGITPAFTWRSSVVHTRTLAAGETVGYGGHYAVQAKTQVATVPVGYGDGLLHELADAGAPVLVNGKRARLLATCMDACFIDVSGIACAAGDEVVFYGTAQDGTVLNPQEVAGLIGHEGVYLTSKLTHRVERVVEP